MATPVLSPEAPSFPVHWDDPADARRTYMIDMMHQPNPISPLSQSVSLQTFPYGWGAAAAELNMPFGKPYVRHLNYYQYEGQRLVIPRDAEDAQARAQITEETMRREIGRLGERWHDEHLPRIEQLLQRMGAIEAAVATAEPSVIAAMMDELVTLAQELWTIHFRIAFPMLLAMQGFDELYADLFGGSPADSHALLAGRSTKSVQAGIGLADLATEARSAGVDHVIRDIPLDEIVITLRESGAGRAFLARLDDYLAEFGLRQDLFDTMVPTWRENPTIPLASVRSYLMNSHDPRAAHAAKIEAADAAVATAREKLASYPAPIRGQFEAMLQSARDAAFLQEEHNFYIDQQGIAWGRLIFMAIGRRLVERDEIDAPDDIFMLRFAEAKELVVAPGGRNETRDLVAERRAGMAHARTLTPPPFLGPPPEAPPDNLVGRALMSFFGGPPQPADAPDQLKGAAGSRGIATGPAFIARSLEEAKAIQPGQILVAMTTMPAWTPFFGVAAAVVTETGGPLSHCAIVAREYGIPAVVGAHGAMRAIIAGQVITVDGSRGIVLLATDSA